MTDKKPQLIAKEQVVEQIQGYIKESPGIVLADYRGLNVAEVTELRAKMRGANIVYQVSKNTMIKRAADNLDISGLDEFLAGPTAIVFGQDPVNLAKLLTEFAEKHKALKVKAGLLDQAVISKDQVQALAKIPPREVLLAKMLGAMQSPMYGFAGAATALLRNFVYALDQIREQKAQA